MTEESEECEEASRRRHPWLFAQNVASGGNGAPTSFLVVVNRHLPPRWLVWVRRGAFNATNGCRIRRKKRRWIYYEKTQLNMNTNMECLLRPRGGITSAP
jgi:hypothetical protein